MSVNEYDINMLIKINTNIRNDSFHSGDVVFSATPVFWMTSLKDISTIDEGSVFFLFILFTVLLYHGRRNFHSPGICALMTIIYIFNVMIGEIQESLERTFENEVLIRRHCSTLISQMTTNRSKRRK